MAFSLHYLLTVAPKGETMNPSLTKMQRFTAGAALLVASALLRGFR